MLKSFDLIRLFIQGDQILVKIDYHLKAIKTSIIYPGNEDAAFFIVHSQRK